MTTMTVSADEDDMLVKRMLRHSLNEESIDLPQSPLESPKEAPPPAPRFGWLEAVGGQRSDSEDHPSTDYGWFWTEPEASGQPTNRRKAAMAPTHVDSGQLRHEKILMQMGMERWSPVSPNTWPGGNNSAFPLSPMATSPHGGAGAASATDAARAAEAAVHACGRNGGHVVVATRSFLLLPGRWPDDGHGGIIAAAVAAASEAAIAEASENGHGSNCSAVVIEATDITDAGEQQQEQVEQQQQQQQQQRQPQQQQQQQLQLQLQQQQQEQQQPKNAVAVATAAALAACEEGKSFSVVPGSSGGSGSGGGGSVSTGCSSTAGTTFPDNNSAAAAGKYLNGAAAIGNGAGIGDKQGHATAETLAASAPALILEAETAVAATSAAASAAATTATLAGLPPQKVVFAVAISSVRIVGRSTSQHAEYQVVLTSGPGKVLSGWKRFKNFVGLAATITATGKLPRSEYAWENVQRSRKWFRCLDEDYVRAKSVSLSIFLGQVLFEIETPKLLTDFVLGLPSDLATVVASSGASIHVPGSGNGGGGSGSSSGGGSSRGRSGLRAIP